MQSPSSQLNLNRQSGASTSTSSASSQFPCLGDAKIFRAGAGAGKTTQLVQEVYEFYKSFRAQNAKNPRIVLTTFTRKATQELKERLMLKAQQNKDYGFLNFVLSRQTLLISTIHGLLQVFLKQYAQVIDLDPGFEIVENTQLSREAKIILKNLMHQSPEYSEFLEEFTFQQLTSILIEHSQNQIQKKNLKFFDEADFKKAQDQFWVEVQTQFETLVQNIEAEDQSAQWFLFIADLKSLISFLAQKNIETDSFLKILEQIKKPRKSSKNPVVSEDLDALITETVNKYKKYDYSKLDITYFKKYLVLYKKFEDLAAHFHSEFVNYKKQQGCLSLSDLESMSLEILSQSEDRYSSFSKTYDYWLIDEFQDTAPVQVEILRKIIGSQKFFVVGDPQQSIYFFRGARVRVFNEMQTLIQNSQGQLHLLNTNYRSEPQVMSFLNYFFKNYEVPFESMQIGRKAAAIANETPLQSPIQIGLFEDESLQTQNIIQHILNLSQSVELGEICVIARKNDHLKHIAQSLKQNQIPYYLHSAQGFNERREILDLKSFLKFLVNPHDNMNLISLLRSPWFAVEEVDIIAVTHKNYAVSFWNDFCKCVEDSDATSPHAYAAILDLKKYQERSLTEGISHILQTMVQEKRILESCQKLDPTGRREANIWKFISTLRKEDHNPDFNFLNFIENGSEVISTDTGGENSDAVSSLEPNQVQLMTVHMSKGLEFKHVIAPYIHKSPNKVRHETYLLDEETEKWGLSFKLGEDTSQMPLPMKAVLQSIADEEAAENHRLFYVTLTRAKEGIFLCSSGKAESKSWLSSMQIRLEPGLHEQKDFKYDVVSEVASLNSLPPKKQKNLSVPLPLFQLETRATEKNSTSVTETMKWLFEGVDKVVPLMKAALEGVRVHRLFESLRYGDPLLKTASVEDTLAIEWLKNLKEIPFEKILKKGFAEWGFVLKTPAGSLSGKIDLWGEVDGHIYILDYKTGRSSFAEKALVQLRAYAHAVQKIHPTTPITLAALYPFEKKIIIE